MIEYFISKLIKKMHFKSIKASDIHSTVKIEAGCHIINSKIGKYSYTGYDCQILNTNIGAFCSLGNNIIIGGAPHSIEWVSSSPVFNENKDSIKTKFSHHKFSLDNTTNIGNDVWIGNNVLIKANISIGDGVVIGMGSVVTKNVGPYEIWAGNPAKFIRNRFDNRIKEFMLDIAWWEWSDKKLKTYSPYINDIALFVKKVNENR